MILKLGIFWVVMTLFVTNSESYCPARCSDERPVEPSAPTGFVWYYDNYSGKCLFIWKMINIRNKNNWFLNKEICEITCMGCKSPSEPSGYNLRQEAHTGSCPAVTTTHDRDFNEDNCASDDDCEDSAQKCCPDGGRFKSCLDSVSSLNQINTNRIYKEPAQPRQRQNVQYDNLRNGYPYTLERKKKNGRQIGSSERYKGINADRLRQFFSDDDYTENWDHSSGGVNGNSNADFGVDRKPYVWSDSDEHEFSRDWW